MSEVATVVAGARRVPRASRLGLSRNEILPTLVAIAVTFVVFRIASDFFLAPRNLANLLGQVAPLELIAVASTVMIVMGEIDLSLGSVAGFAGALGASLLLHQSVPWPIAVVATLAAGVAVSGAQGLICVVGRVRSFAVTLAGFFLWYGVQLWILGTGGQIVLRRQPVANLASARIPETAMLLGISIGGTLLVAGFLGIRLREPAGRRLTAVEMLIRTCTGFASVGALAWFVTYLEGGGGVPLIFVLVVAVTVVVWLILTRTATGRHFYAVGGDVDAARASGISVTRVKWTGFAMAGGLAAFAGLAIASYTGGADTSTGGGSFLLEGIGAAVVGGVSLLGGRGSVWGAFGGAVLLAGVQNGLALLSLNFYVVDVVEGLVVLAALLADGAIRRRLVVL